MYVWLGANIDNQLTNFKDEIFKIANENNLTTQFKYHPAHISLIISFEIEEKTFEDIIDDVLKYYKSVTTFNIETLEVEIENDILWFRHKENDNLIKIHNDLCKLVSTKHNVKLHPFDYDYKYHTTLFLNAEKIDNVIIDKIKELKKPKDITINKLFVGFSKDNKSENYKIYKSINLRSC